MYFFFQAEDGIRDLVRSRGLGDVYKRQLLPLVDKYGITSIEPAFPRLKTMGNYYRIKFNKPCLLYTSDAADERSSVDLGGRRIINKKKSISIRIAELPLTKT